MTTIRGKRTAALLVAVLLIGGGVQLGRRDDDRG